LNPFSWLPIVVSGFKVRRSCGTRRTRRPRHVLELMQLEDRTVPSTLTVSPTTLINATVNSPYSASFLATGGSATGYTFSENGILPAGLSVANGQVTHIQDAGFGETANGGGTSQSTQAFGLTPLAGDAIVVWTWGWASSALTGAKVSCTDTGNNSYTQYAFEDGGSSKGNWSCIFVCADITSAAQFTDSVKLSGVSNCIIAVAASEFSGVAGVETSAIRSGTTAAPSVGLTTSNAGDLLCAVMSGNNLVQATVTTPSGWTQTAVETNGAVYQVGQAIYQSGSSAGAYTAKWNKIGTTSWGTGMVALEGYSGATLSGVPTTSGAWGFTVTATDSAGNVASQQYTLTVNAASILTVSPATLASATVNSAYSATVSATGGSGTYTFAVTTGSLPSWLTLSSSTGALNGTPTTTGSSSFTITATDSANSAFKGSKAYGLTVNAASSLTVNPTTLTSATANSAYSSTLSATGGSATYTFAVTTGSLPSWLTLNANTGVLSGTPTKTGLSSFTITATDANSTTLKGSKAYTLAVNAASNLTVSPTTLINATANSTYNATASATGGSGTCTFAITTGSLPSWLTLNANTGVLSGMSTFTGSTSFTMTATDSATSTLKGSKAYTLTVNAASSLTVSPTTLANAAANSAYSATVQATGGSGTYTFAVTTGSLPSWLTLNANTGVLSGTPTSAGSSSFTITATDSANSSLKGSKAYSLTVAAGSSGQEPLLHQSDVQYVGAFRVPNYYNNVDQMSFGGNALAYDSANNSLFITGMNDGLADISIPQTIVNSSNLDALTTDSILQPWKDVVDGIPHKLSGASDGSSIGGLMVYNGELIGTEFAYYSGAEAQVLSHFVLNSLDLSTATVQGLYQVGSGGRVLAGYMTPIPSEWQSALGGFTALTGLSDQPIVDTESSGPAAFGFNPQSLISSGTSTDTPYLDYPASNPLGAYQGPANPLQAGTTSVTGDVFVPGTSSILFYGVTGTSYEGYGDADPWGDNGPTVNGGKGPQSLNGQYAFQVWAYNANDLAAVRQGSLQPDQVMPYDVWNFSLPIPGNYNPGGVTFDPSTGRVYVVAMNADTEADSSSLPLVEVFQVTVPTGTPAAAPPQIGTLTAAPSITPNPNYPSSDGAQVPQWVGTYAGPVKRGDPIVITAGNVYALNSGDSITQVSFYISSNNSAPFSSSDTLLGHGTGAQNLPTGGSTNWTLTASTSGLASGTYTIFAQALDSDGLLSDPIAMTLTIA